MSRAIIKDMQFTDNEIANLSQFVQTELQYLEPEVYKVEYPELTYDKVIPIVHGQSGAQQVAYDVYDRAGEAQLITSYSKDVPRATTGKTRKFRGVYEFGQAAAYTLMELRSAQMARLPLEIRELEAARYGHEIRMNKLAYFGDKNINESDFYGLLNNSEVGTFVNGNTTDGYPVVGTTATPLTWAAAIAAATTSDEIAKIGETIRNQINFLFSSINNKTLGVEAADTLLIPRLQYNLLATTVVSSFTQQTILDWLMKTSPYLSGTESIMPINELAYKNAIVGADGSATPFGSNRFDYITNSATKAADLLKDAMFVYKKMPHKLKFHIETPFQFLAPQVNNFEFVINGYSSVAGNITYYPAGMTMAFGI